MFDEMSVRAKQAFPNLEIKFKNESTLMKVLGKILFFNPAFMNEYITTLGSTIYFPTKEYVKNNDSTAATILLHELTHVYDSKKRNNLLFSLLYLFPQIFVLSFIPLLFIFGWKIALFSLIFLLPIPAYFRMVDERKAYTISLYSKYTLNKNKKLFNLEGGRDFYILQFKNSAYYFMYPFNSINTYFNDVLNKIKAGEKPYYEPELYSIIDKVMLG